MKNFTLKQIQNIAEFNPSEKLEKGILAKSIPMAKLKEFQRKIIGYEIKSFSGGSKFRNGDILLAKITPCLENGKTAFVDILAENEIAFGSTEFIVIRAKNNNDPEFLYYFTISPNFRKRAIECMEGTSGRKRVNENTLKTLELPIPNYKTQKAIANILSALDQKIALNNQINVQLEQMAKTLYDYWFVQFDFPDDNGNPYKSNGGDMVYNDILKREIPKGWGITTVGDITICHDAKRVPLSSQERACRKGSIPYYGATGIFDYIDNFIFDGDYILLAEDGSVMDELGNPILQRIGGKTWVNNHAHVLQPIKNHSCFLAMLLLRHIPVVQIKTGSIQMKINQENLNNYPILSIPDTLKSSMNSFLNPIDKEILNNQKQNQQLSQLRDFLLPMLMNGQVGIKYG